MARRVADHTPRGGPGETRAEVKRHALHGLSPREIAKILEISTQSVHYHLSALRADGELPEERAS